MMSVLNTITLAVLTVHLSIIEQSKPVIILGSAIVASALLVSFVGHWCREVGGQLRRMQKWQHCEYQVEAFTTVSDKL